MSDFDVINIREVLYSTSNLDRATSFFEGFGGWNRVGTYETNRRALDAWSLPDTASGKEILIQSDHYPSGQLRLIQFEGVEQSIIRSSQQPWDVGGIMDINLRVHEVANNFENLREMGWHGLSDPMLQVMGPFKLYDILMKGYDDIIIAFTHRLEPPMELPSQINFPTHVYKTSITVNDLEAAERFYVDVLGCKVLNQFTVIKDKPQETMFGLPFNMADKVACKVVILSIHGGTDVDFQIVEFDGVTGKDFKEKAKPPNRGFLMYRVEVKNLGAYQDFLINNKCELRTTINQQIIEPYGEVNVFSLISPNGAWFEFFEIV